jgi:SAM-dependent methyltransferase
MSSELPWTGERYVPQLGGDIAMEHLHRYLFARALAQGRDVLDVACGEGYGSAILAETARSVLGVDIAPEVVAHAAQRYARPNVAFQQGDCAALALPEASRDLVVSFETIEHHARHEEMLAGFKRVLRPGGVAVISTPDKEPYDRLQEKPNEFHVRELTRAEFEALLGRYFRHVAILGQRMVYGSLLAPEAGSAPGWREASGAGLHPSSPAIYLVAIASDAPLPELPASWLDGTADYQAWRRDTLHDLWATRDRIARLEGSVFWRMTRPLRWLRELLR